MGRSVSFDRYNVLENALALFWLRGFSAASVRQLEDVTDLNPGSLYYHFTNKEQLFIATLRHYIDHHLQARINKHLTSAYSMESLRRFLTSGYRHCQEDKYRNCCFLASACSELRLLPPEVSELVNKGLDSILTGFITCLTRVSQKGLICCSLPTHKLAQELLNLYLSLQLLAQARPNKHQLDAIVKHSLKHLLHPQVE